MLPLSAVQTQVWEILVPALAPVPVLDLAGPNQEYPYITLGEFVAAGADVLDSEAVNLDLTVHVWSRQKGMQECEQLMQTAKDALHGRRWPASAFWWVDTEWLYGQTMRDPDGLTRHGVLR